MGGGGVGMLVDWAIGGRRGVWEGRKREGGKGGVCKVDQENISRGADNEQAQLMVVGSMREG